MKNSTRERVTLTLFTVAVGVIMGVAIIGAHYQDKREVRHQTNARHQIDKRSSGIDDDLLFWTVIYPIVISP